MYTNLISLQYEDSIDDSISSRRSTRTPERRVETGYNPNKYGSRSQRMQSRGVYYPPAEADDDEDPDVSRAVVQRTPQLKSNDAVRDDDTCWEYVFLKGSVL